MKIIRIFCSLIAALTFPDVLAAVGNITFNGTVSVNTCTLAAADASKVLKLPDVSATSIRAAGPLAYLNYSLSSSFNFSACPAGLSIIISNYTYQGALYDPNTALATGTATPLSLVLMQSTTPSTSAMVAVNGTSDAINQTPIFSNAATVPVIVGVFAQNSSGRITLPTVGNYTGVYIVAFTYS